MDKEIEALMARDVGQCDLLLITLDTLRYDVATRALEEKQTPFLASQLPKGGGSYVIRRVVLPGPRIRPFLPVFCHSPPVPVRTSVCSRYVFQVVKRLAAKPPCLMRLTS